MTDDRERVIALVRDAYRTKERSAVDRALAAADRYLRAHPDDWQVALACEPLLLVAQELASERDVS